MTAPSVPLQTFRNLGKAYFVQGKYVEATGQFQKVAASGKALAADHLILGLALMEANRLDAALGEMTTAKQMDPHLVAADYNLGILYKREFREESLTLPLSNAAGLASLIPTWREDPGQLDLLAMTRSGQLRAFEKQGPPVHWVEVKMNGFKSNSRGIGSVVEFKAGNYYNKVVVTGSPLRVFTGNLFRHHYYLIIGVIQSNHG